MKQCIAMLFILALAAGCGSSSSQSGTPRTRGTSTPHHPSAAGTPGHSGAVPQTTPPRIKSSQHHPTSTKPAHVGRLSTVAPVPLATPTTIPSQAFTATLFGTITDAKTHSPLAGAIVKLGAGGRERKSDGFGRYKIAFPGGPMLTVTVTMPGYAQALTIGRVSAHHSLRLNFQLSRIVAGRPSAPPLPSVFGTPQLPTKKGKST